MLEVEEICRHVAIMRNGRIAFDGSMDELRSRADDVQYRDPDTRLSSRAAVLDRLRSQVDAFAGFDYTIRHTYGDSAGGAVVEWNMSGDYAGKPVSLDIVTAYDFLGGRIVSERNYWDNAALQGQLG